MNKLRKTMAWMAAGIMVVLVSVPVYAQTGTTETMVGQTAEEQFDAAFYVAEYPDVALAVGTDPQVLYNHYLMYGMKEGRLPFAGAVPGQNVNEGAAETAIRTPETPVQETSSGFTPVPLNNLANYNSIKKKMTNEEFQQAYDAALQIVTPLANLSREEQLVGIASSLRVMFDNGMSYSMSADHYNDPYGYFVLGSVSCAGCVRATGLCLNILGIPYEHVNENQYSHQWCRVNVNGTYWICDAFGLYVGPESVPYQHPYLD